jgi:hypothetical protein
VAHELGPFAHNLNSNYWREGSGVRARDAVM